MYLSHLRLSFFRNYDDLHLTFSEGVNCISGKNGAGKSNILDALHFLALTKGFRSSQDKQAIKEDESFFFIEGNAIKSENLSALIQCNLMLGKTKKLLINSQPLAKMSEHIGSLPLVAVLPNDTELINEGSSTRRKFMDSLISQYNKIYLDDLIKYEKILAQRNALLKNFNENKYFDAEQLALWNMQMVPLGQNIWAERKKFLADFIPIFAEYFREIVSQKETPEVEYDSKIAENTTLEWENLLAEAERKDRVNQNTSIGIHKDDLSFSINGSSVKNFGSQGQQKTFVIALKLAQYELLANYKKVPPLLLLDDIFDKLDEYRLQSIADLLDKKIRGQVFVTDTSLSRLQEIFQHSQREVRYFQVEKGGKVMENK